ncbi:hypothetical protein ACVRY7_00195 [Streptococcus ictaluri]|uniref:hypothetical protein n=1 Tax=Streptococcus ictaluri TaxID=380397 RepID=UPI0003047DF8|nr:hypothetical protein [Streptococcus ictaluri]
MGYQKAIQEWQLEPHLLGQEICFDGGYTLGEELAKHNPHQITAIFSTADEMIVGIKEGLEAHQKKSQMIFRSLDLIICLLHSILALN